MQKIEKCMLPKNTTVTSNQQTALPCSSIRLVDIKLNVGNMKKIFSQAYQSVVADEEGRAIYGPRASVRP